jgi:hypothetical protein
MFPVRPAILLIFGLVACPLQAQESAEEIEKFWKDFTETGADIGKQKALITESQNLARSAFESQVKAWLQQVETGGEESGAALKKGLEDLAGAYQLALDKRLNEWFKFVTGLSAGDRKGYLAAVNKYLEIAGPARTPGAVLKPEEADRLLKEGEPLLAQFTELGEAWYRGWLAALIGQQKEQKQDFSGAAKAYEAAQIAFGRWSIKEEVDRVSTKAAEMKKKATEQPKDAQPPKEPAAPKDAEAPKPADPGVDRKPDSAKPTPSGEPIQETVKLAFKKDKDYPHLSPNRVNWDEPALWRTAALDKGKTLGWLGDTKLHFKDGKITLDWDNDNKEDIRLKVAGGKQGEEEIKVRYGDKLDTYFVEMKGMSQENLFGIGLRYGTKDLTVIGYRRSCHVEGTIPKLGNEKIQIIDDNSNGYYDDFSEDGIVVGSGPQALIQPLSRVLEIHGQLYEFRPERSGRTAEIKTFTGPTGRLKVVWKGIVQPTWLLFQGEKEADRVCVNLAGLKEGANVPAGTYRFFRGIVLKGKAPKGPNCEIGAGKTQPIEVKAGEVTTVEMGAPFTFDVDQGNPFPDPKEKELVFKGSGFKVMGKAGEYYTRFWPVVPRPKVSLRVVGGAEVLKDKNMKTAGNDDVDKIGAESLWYPKEMRFKGPMSTSTQWEVKMSMEDELLGKIDLDYPKAGKQP